MESCLFQAAFLLLFSAMGLGAANSPRVFRAGASAIDISPKKFPVIVNGGFLEAKADKVNDRLHARCLVLDDGATRLAIAVVDSCMLPRELIDEAKRIAHEKTGIVAERMLVSATHTHSAPSAMGCLGASADSDYLKELPAQIAAGIEQAARNLAPAQIGWTVVDDFEHTHNRRWIFRSDKMKADPFGGTTVRANMHPGYENPDCVGPSGPVDPGLSMLAIQTSQGKPLALLANYSMHYFGSAPVSADYCGRFAENMKRLIGADAVEPPFVGIMSQGTSGDQMWMDYGKPKTNLTLDEYARAVAQVAYGAYQTIQFRDWVPLAMAESKLTLRRRTPSAERLAWARQIVEKMGDRKPQNQIEVYAREQIYLHDDPVRELKLQAIRIGGLGIAAIPNEVFAITGLKIKARSPLTPSFTIELANGSEGYVPPPAQHALGGYTTWPARTAALEIAAEPIITEAVLQLLEKVSGSKRRQVVEKRGAYVRAVLGSKPAAYWRLSEFEGPMAIDSSGHGNHAVYEKGTAFYLDGPPSDAFSGAGTINRCVHLAGGGIRASLKGITRSYSVEMWVWNGRSDLGKAGLPPRKWVHCVWVREAEKITVFLNGSLANAEQFAAAELPRSVGEIVIGGAGLPVPNFEGKIDEVAVYTRALTPREIGLHFGSAGPSTDRNSAGMR